MAGYPCEPCCEQPCPDPSDSKACGAADDYARCLSGMYAVIHLDFTNSGGHPELNGDELDGYYLFLPTCTASSTGAYPGPLVYYWEPPDGLVEAMRRRLVAGGWDMTTPPGGCLLNWNFGVWCDEGDLNIAFDYGSDPACGDDDHHIGAFDTFDISSPTAITNGTAFTLTQRTSVGDEIVLTYTATVTFYGIPCGTCPPDPCANGPTITFTLDNVDEGAGLDDCESPPAAADIYTGCDYVVDLTVTAGSCPIIGCFWSDGYSDENCERTTANLEDECGGHAGELTVWVIDEGGCVDSHTEEYECCECCTPEGGYTLEDEAYPDPIPDGWGSISSTCLVPLSGNSCNGGLNLCHLWCFYKITLDEGTFTDCGEVKPNSLRYLIRWGGLKDRNGDPLIDGCYDELDEIHVSHDAGFEGDGCICVEIVPFDELGCEGETIYLLFDTGIAEIDADCPTCA